MSLPENIESLIANLPDTEGARRFYLELANKYPSEEKRLVKNLGLLSDVLTLAAFSPLLATTLLQHPNYISWLNRQRVSAKVRGKDELLESLARFALVNSQVEPNILLARFPSGSRPFKSRFCRLPTESTITRKKSVKN